MSLKHTLGALALALGLLPAGPAAADYPERPVRIVIPFAAGGPADIVGREFAQLFGQALGQPVVVVNAGGGHGVPALNQVLGAPADGYTLLMPASGNMTIPSKAMQGKDVLALLAPISQLTQSPHVLVVTAGLPVDSVQGLIDYAKAHPGKVNFGSAGVGGVAHLGMELFKSQAKVDVVHVPYRGTSQVITDLASGQVQALFSSMPSLKPMIDKGAVKALAMSAPSSGADTSKLPVVSATLPGMAYTTWYGLFAKAGTPPEVLEKLNQAVVETLKDPELNRKFESEGVEFVASTPQQLEALVRQDTKKWTALIEQAGIQVE
ncbi:tripartite tricarboxylate transporter family receptor [Bordetella bronchiseptica MBORD635]|uniref:Bug family tripartite tricarboxylate transporter substrate binding protein n=1 Tax=Bordetella bronchiseptica TaxID=518 RepID=UPI000461A4A0|nr:tripartite tricarboxylate transporter substrate-binding protein [Bordetella bronchiseptica]KDC74477.1 tripartite tricarboxylate transporter family receptor [Bordetella bronchiseptica MBORD635]